MKKFGIEVAKTPEEVLASIKAGTPFKYNSVLVSGRVWTIAQSNFGLTVHDSKTGKRRRIREHACLIILHNVLNPKK